MRELVIDTAKVFKPLLIPSRYKGAWGGRGSGKSHFFAESLIEHSLYQRGMRSVCIREVQKTLKQSSKRLIEDKLSEFRLGSADGFKVFNEVIQTPGDGIITFTGMQDHNAESIKSLEGFGRAWIEEAQTMSSRSLSLLRPTIRAPGSELWFSWNPRRKTDAVDVMLRGAEIPTGAVVIRANWQDNPRFPAELEQERQDCLRMDPDQYPHIWDGDYVTLVSGAYYSKSLIKAKEDGRISRVAADSLLTHRAFVDIGGTGARADAFAMWIAQFVGREVRVLDYYEAVGQPLATHLEWLRERKLGPERLKFWLPHDGATHDKVFSVSYESALQAAGYDVTVIPNQGVGAAKARIEAGRRLFPHCWFNADTTEPGREALGWYHEKRDEQRNIGLGPEHDWCFAAGTCVMTPGGWVPIMDLSVHNEVVTPCGNRRIIRSGIVRMTDKWTTTKGIRSTPEHRFFTKRGLVTAESLRSTDEFWTRDDWGLRILGLLCVGLPSGFMGAITSATQGATDVEHQSSCIVWCMRLFMVGFRSAMKSITSTTIRTTIIQKTLRLYRNSNTAGSTKQSHGTNVSAGSAVEHSGVTTLLEVDAARPVKPQTTPGSSENVEPAYSLTVDRDECYFVRGDDGAAYLVANSSHGSDAFGLMAVAYETPATTPSVPRRRGSGLAR